MKRSSALFLATALSLPLLLTPAALAEVTYNDLLAENGGDLQPNHWAAEAIQQLVDKYGIMAGYPDKTFKGQRTLTRFEMAAALYQVMKYFDAQLEAATRVPDFDFSSLATKAELEQVAALQRELQAELDLLKAEHISLEKRVTELEKFQIHGQIEVRYRDRVAVTDGTDRNSTLFGGGNVSPTKRVTSDLDIQDRPASDNTNEIFNNIGMMSRDQYGLPNRYNGPAEANVTIDDLAPFRLRTSLDLGYKWSDDLSVRTGIDLYEIGVASSSLSNNLVIGNGGHDLAEGMPGGASFVFREAVIDYVTPGTGQHYQMGLTNFRKVLNTGSRFSSLFDQGSWNGRDYGMVGFGGSEVALSNDGVKPYRNSLSRYWNGGLNVSMVDPDSLDYNQVTAPAVSFDATWDWGSFMVGLNGGSVQTNRLMAADIRGNLSTGGPAVMGDNANFSTSSALYDGAILQGLDRKATGLGNTRRVGNHLALPSAYGDGYAVAGLEAHFWDDGFPVRLQLAAMNYLNDSFTDWAGPSRREVSGTLDLGWDKNFGMSLQVNKSWIGFDRHSLGLFFNNIADSGIDVQLGSTLATRGLFAVGDLATGSAGLALSFPLWRAESAGKDDVRLMLAARQAFGDQFGASGDPDALNQLYKDSGLTVSIPYQNIGGTPLSITAQYSALYADALWQFRSVAHDVSLITRYSF